MTRPDDMTPARILVVDDHPRARESMADILRCAGHEVDGHASAIEALGSVDDHCYDVILTDLRMPGMSGVEFIQRLQRRGVESQIVMVTAHASVESAVEAMRHGAFDYLEKPIDADQLESIVERAMRQAAVEPRRSSVPDASEADNLTMIGDSEPMRRLLRRIRQVAPTDETVLITGESGTGKELVARALHLLSQRAGGPMVSMNCPALSPQLMESELFGHVRGAFTSADAPRVGRFELADGGTILLDEVTEIDLPLQAKLLRVLQERSFERVGASSSVAADVRVVAATNRELQNEVQAGRFRADLYYRLAVVPLHVPALRERRDDIPALVEHFLLRSAQRLRRPPARFRSNAAELLHAYHWPGNVRELENLVTRAAVLVDGDAIDADDLRPWLIDAPRSDQAAPDDGAAPPSPDATPVGMSLHEMERKLIEATLQKFEGHRAKTAQALGIGVRTLTNKLRSYGYAPRANAPTEAA